MCIKKECKCYKGKENEECCNEKVREALRNRNYVFVLIMGIALMIISLVIKTSNDAVFVNQVSFASTITSIILSVIAIWLSISGERNTNEIKTKVSESVDRLIKTTDKSDKLAFDLKNMLSIQNESYNNIKNKIEVALSEIGGVKSTVTSLKDSFMGAKQNVKKIPDDICLFFQNILNGIPQKSNRKYLCKIIINMFKKMKNDPDIDMIHAYIKVSDKINISQDEKYVMYGIIVALKHNGFFNDIKNCEVAKKEKNKINE